MGLGVESALFKREVGLGFGAECEGPGAEMDCRLANMASRVDSAKVATSSGPSPSVGMGGKTAQVRDHQHEKKCVVCG